MTWPARTLGIYAYFEGYMAFGIVGSLWCDIALTRGGKVLLRSQAGVIAFKTYGGLFSLR